MSENKALRNEIAKTIAVLSKHPLVASKKIPPNIVKDWIVETLRVDPERLLWHAKKTLKIGGSEIFAGVAFHRSVKAGAHDEHYSAFLMTNIQDVIKGKVFRRAPQEPNSHMRRGILFEPLARQVYLETLRKAGFTVEVDDKAINALTNNALVDAKHPWLAYNPDDVLIINGSRTLVDYKCPAPDIVTGFDMGVEEAYVHQLHLGHHALGQLGFPVEQLKLVKFNVIEAAITEIDVKVDKKILRENLVAGDYLYKNYIVNNRIPEYQPSLHSQVTLDDIRDALNQQTGGVEAATDYAVSTIKALSAKYSIAKTMSATATKLAANLSKEIIQWADQIDTKTNTTLVVGAVEIKREENAKVDSARLILKAKELGINVDDFRLEKYDTENLLAAIKEQSPASVAELTETSMDTSVVVTRKQKGITADLKNLFISSSEQNLELLIGSIDEAAAQESLSNIEDAITLDVHKRESRRQFFSKHWEGALSTFVQSEQNNSELYDGIDIHQLGEELALESEQIQKVQTSDPKP